MLQHFVVEILAGEIRIQCQKCGKSCRGIGKRHFSVILTLAVFLHLALGSLVILLGFLGHTQHILDIRTVHISNYLC